MKQTEEFRPKNVTAAREKIPASREKIPASRKNVTAARYDIPVPCHLIRVHQGSLSGNVSPLVAVYSRLSSFRTPTSDFLLQPSDLRPPPPLSSLNFWNFQK